MTPAQRHAAFRDVIARRLSAAGFTSNSPELEYVRDWNHAAMVRGELAVELRRGQFGQTRRARLADLEPPQ